MIKKTIKLTLALIVGFLVLSLFSCKKEMLSTPKEDCLQRNQLIIDSLTKEFMIQGEGQKSIAYYWHIKTRDSLYQIAEQLIAKYKVYEVANACIADPDMWEIQKWDMLDSMKIEWQNKSIQIDLQIQDSIQREIQRLKSIGYIKDCDALEPNTRINH